MPIEIRELIIRATVSEGGKKNTNSNENSEPKEKVVETAVAEVFEILKIKKQR